MPKRGKPSGKSRLLQSLGQVSVGEAAEIFRDHLRGCVREMICEVMAAEVTALCGPRHSPAGGDVFRSGSSPGRVIFEGQREEVIRPRVRQRGADGSTTEVPLASYESARNPQRLQASIVAALRSGVSTREIKDVQPEAWGTSKSNVSRHWQQVGHLPIATIANSSLLKRIPSSIRSLLGASPDEIQQIQFDASEPRRGSRM